VLFNEPSCRDSRSLFNVEIGGNSSSYIREYTFVRDAHVFDGLAGLREFQEANWRRGDATERLFVNRVTDNFFAVTGVPLAAGRPIQPGDEDVAVISHRFWTSRL